MIFSEIEDAYLINSVATVYLTAGLRRCLRINCSFIIHVSSNVIGTTGYCVCSFHGSSVNVIGTTGYCVCSFHGSSIRTLFIIHHMVISGPRNSAGECWSNNSHFWHLDREVAWQPCQYNTSIDDTLKER